MADLVFVLITVAFFALAAGLVHVCDRIIGPDEAESEAALSDPPVEAPLPDERREVVAS